jgi:hypothetical protein
MCPEGAPESGAPYRIEIIGARLFILAPLSEAQAGYCLDAPSALVDESS